MVAPGVHAQTMSVPDSLQRGLPTQYCSHTDDKPPSLTHTHSPSESESTGNTHRPCCWSSAPQLIVPALLLIAVTAVKDMDEFETSPSL